MSIATNIQSITPEQLLRMPDDRRYELVDGELVELEMSYLSTSVETDVSTILNNYCRANKLGRVLTSSMGIRCFPNDPNQVRRPDVCFVAAARITDELRNEGYLLIAPDLVVEVLSPNDLAVEVSRKFNEYVSAGVRMIWTIDPEARSVAVYYDNRTKHYRETDEIMGHDILPGFRCKVSDFFPPRAK